MDWQFIRGTGGVEIHQVASCCGNGDKRRADGLQGSNADFFLERKKMEYGPSRPLTTLPFVNDIMYAYHHIQTVQASNKWHFPMSLD